jgi:hypothetical protein
MMKKSLLTFAMAIATYYSYAQNTFPSSGNVGIGTTTPRALLDIRSGTALSGGDIPGTTVITSPNQTVYQGTLSLESNSTVAADQGGSIVFKGIYTGTQPAAYGAIGGFKENGVDANYAGYLAFYSRTNAGLNSERMRISSIGNVGIGTTNPSSYFHGGNNKVIEIFNSNTSANSQSHLVLSTGATLDGSGAGTLTWISKNSSGFQGMAYIGSMLQGDGTLNAAGKLIFATSNGTAVYQRMFIDKDGNVGIATTDTKGYTLAVNGTAIATSMTVKLYANWPDYVFKPQYHLPSLTEVKTYIDRNQRLPDMPSEAEVTKNGINLGEMNALLTKKVEELTLYLIQQKEETDKQIKAQQQQIDELKSRLEKIIN